MNWSPVARSLASQLRLIVTAGPTREWLDPVRFISNPSSGQMGWQMARAGQAIFGEVVYIAGATDARYNQLEGSLSLSVESTLDMQEAVLGQLRNHCLLIMAAAPADYRPAQSQPQKIKKEAQEDLTIQLVRNPDILLSVAERKANFHQLVVVGFAAETDHLEEHALGKMKRKQLDFICANQVFKTTQGFASAENSVLLLSASGSERLTLGPAPKALLAGEILAAILEKMIRAA
ncbi:MAG: phosphopantothenoylcysteine decarboxylase [Spirochaetales bacterium]|nr:phosphopantothenoylcysteine decarboxylase [Spirochaetales bacterium]